MDFCKFKYYDHANVPYRKINWFGYKSAFCGLVWDKNVNYTGPINEQNSTCIPDQMATRGLNGWQLVWTSDRNVNNFIGRDNRELSRSVDRMIASFKYIETLLTGEPRRPY